MKTPLVFLTLMFVMGCSQESLQSVPVNNQSASSVAVHADSRWYTAEQVREGRALFAQYCATCHGVNAEATPDWRTPTKDGNYPPPPLNGSAHAWHHPISVLDEVIRVGGAPYGGVMPAWESVLDSEQRLSIIASFQDYWSDEIFEIWLERDPDY